MRRVAVWLGSVVLAAAAMPAAAQYRCVAPNGVYYESASQCRGASIPGNAQQPSRAPSPGVRYFPPAETESRYQQRPPSIGEAPPQLKYMSPQCSGLHDALRTAQARGLNYDTVTKMRKDYYDQCSENESEARTRLAQEMRDKSMQKREAQLGEARERERTALQIEQCGESKRILRTKRARTDLNEGERAELDRFEANYKARCL
jgi:hypothetical protein